MRSLQAGGGAGAGERRTLYSESVHKMIQGGTCDETCETSSHPHRQRKEGKDYRVLSPSVLRLRNGSGEDHNNLGVQGGERVEEEYRLRHVRVKGTILTHGGRAAILRGTLLCSPTLHNRAYKTSSVFRPIHMRRILFAAYGWEHAGKHDNYAVVQHSRHTCTEATPRG